MWCGLGAFPADARIARCTLVRFGVQLNPNPTTRLQLLARSAGHNQLWIGHLPVLQHGCNACAVRVLLSPPEMRRTRCGPH